MKKALPFIGNRMAVLASFLLVAVIFLGAYDLWFNVRTLTTDQMVALLAVAFGLFILASILCIIGDNK